MKIEIKYATNLVAGNFCPMSDFMKIFSARRIYEYINREGFEEEFGKLESITSFKISDYNEFYMAYCTYKNKELSEVSYGIPMGEIIDFGLEHVPSSEDPNGFYTFRERPSYLGDFICTLIDMQDGGTETTFVSLDSIEDGNTYIGIPHETIDPFQMCDQTRIDYIRHRYRWLGGVDKFISRHMKELFIPEYKNICIRLEYREMWTHTDINR